MEMSTVSEDTAVVSDEVTFNKFIAAPLKWIIDSMLPVKTISTESFKNVIQHLRPGFRPASHSQITKILSLLCQIEEKKFVEFFKDTKVSLNFDLWINDEDLSCTSVTAYSISAEWKLRSAYLLTFYTDDDEFLTEEWLANEAIDTLMDKYQLKSIENITINSKNRMKSVLSNRPLNHCVFLKLHQAVTYAFKLPAVFDALKASRKLSAYFFDESDEGFLLHERQNTEQPIRLTHDVPEDWCSSLKMMKNIITLKSVVHEILSDVTVTKPKNRVNLTFTPEVWRVINGIVPVLEELKSILKKLEQIDLPSSSSVFIALYDIMQTVLLEKETDFAVITEFKKELKKALAANFDLDSNGRPKMKCLKTSELLIATLLDARYKKQMCEDILTPEQLKVLEKRLLSLINQDDKTNEFSKPSDDSDEFGSKQKLAEIELLDYLNLSISAEDPLEWWKANEVRFPRLSHVARCLLAIPIGTVIYYIHDAPMYEERRRLEWDGESDRLLLFLHTNYHRNGDSVDEKFDNKEVDELLLQLENGELESDEAEDRDDSLRGLHALLLQLINA